MSKKKTIVHCLKHGHESKDWAGKQVVVPTPKSKKDRLAGGCPFCRSEKRAVEAGGQHEIAA